MKPLKTSTENLKTEMKATTTMEFSLFQKKKMEFSDLK
jgi:hypothetical protein